MIAMDLQQFLNEGDLGVHRLGMGVQAILLLT